MKIEYLHASKFGNGAKVAAHFKEKMAANGVDVDVHHIREVRPEHLPQADLYVFSSPGRIGKPIRAMRRFLKKLNQPTGTGYAILTTEAMPKPDKKTGRISTDEELEARHQRVGPIMNELLQAKGFIKVAEEKVHVTGLRGPLEDEWKMKVDAFANELCATRAGDAAARARAPRAAA
jgi:multimeric flavodoxin WrbA